MIKEVMMNNLSPLSKNAKKELVMQGMKAAMSIRRSAGVDLKIPVCIYKLCELQKVIVRFNNVNMEGMYDKSPKPRIHLSALRPLVRRAFTCAHELGHHIFDHGSTIDELRDDQTLYAQRPPYEILADSFAAFVLMPPLGIREAFIKRGLNPATASASEIFAIACNFGVGQATLVNHLTYNLDMLTSMRRDMLGKITLKKIRTEVIGEEFSSPLVVADKYWNSPTLDIEQGSLLLVPMGVIVDVNMLCLEKDLPNGKLFRAINCGITRVAIPGTIWATYVRVCKRQYVGLAQYRHLEELSDD